MAEAPASKMSCIVCVLGSTRVSVCSGLLMPSSTDLHAETDVKQARKYAQARTQSASSVQICAVTHLISCCIRTASFSTSSHASTTPSQATLTLLADWATSRKVGNRLQTTRAQSPANVARKNVQASASHAGSDTVIVLVRDGGGGGRSGAAAATLATSSEPRGASCKRNGLGGGGGTAVHRVAVSGLHAATRRRQAASCAARCWAKLRRSVWQRGGSSSSAAGASRLAVMQRTEWEVLANCGHFNSP